jgi:hypothetical protein
MPLEIELAGTGRKRLLLTTDEENLLCDALAVYAETCGEEDSEEKACELLDLLRDKTMRVVLTLYEMEAEQQ